LEVLSLFKKICIVLATFIFTVFIGQVAVNAAAYDNIKDNLNYLTDSEKEKLQADIDGVVTDYDLDVVVVITKETEGKSSQAFADDYYDYGEYGVGSEHSGLLMLINMGKREVWISTTGKAINIFTDTRISTMVNNARNSLSNGKYYEACTTFIEEIKYYSKLGIPAGQHQVGTGRSAGSTYFERVLRLIKAFYVYIIALIIAILTTLITSLSSKGKVTITNRTYEQAGSFNLSTSRDDFIRESTTRTVIESNSGTKSSTHKGSTGRNHGGGGGSF
jgi:uncharacterized protein